MAKNAHFNDKALKQEVSLISYLQISNRKESFVLLNNMLNGVKSLSMFIFFIVFSLFLLLLPKKYVICIKTNISPICLDPIKRIFQLLKHSFNTPFLHRTPMHSLSIHRTPMHHTAMHSSSSYGCQPANKRPELFCECPNMHADRFYRFFGV